MDIRATAKIKINATKEIIKTVKAYTKSLQFCVDQAWRRKIKNNVRLHPFVYKKLRKALPAQLTIACISQACGIVKKAKSRPIIHKASVGFNFPRSAKLIGNVLMLRLLKKRQSFKLSIPPCYKEYFTWKINESLLRIDKKGRCFFLFCFSKEVDAKSSDVQNRVLGVDLGVNNLAVTSDSRFFHSSKVKQVKRKFKHLRSVLQAKGTRSARKRLKSLSGREQRFMAWVNHNISKKIVAVDCNKIVMEDLKGIRKQRRGKIINYWISNWSFFQLQKFITYKAQRKGIEVIRVKPYFTSQLCHRCGRLGVRSFGSFAYSHCNLSSFSADLNAARNLAEPMLAQRQAAVIQPYIQSDDVKGHLTTATELMDKSH